MQEHPFFGLSADGEVITIGIHPAAYERIKAGHTGHCDLRTLGLSFRVILFAAETADEAARVVGVRASSSERSLFIGCPSTLG